MSAQIIPFPTRQQFSRREQDLISELANVLINPREGLDGITPAALGADKARAAAKKMVAAMNCRLPDPQP